MCAAIDVKRLAGDEPAILADQEQAGGGDLVDGALPAERDADGVRQAAVIPLRPDGRAAYRCCRARRR
jgi:hypothetical protein